MNYPMYMYQFFTSVFSLYDKFCFEAKATCKTLRYMYPIFHVELYEESHALCMIYFSNIIIMMACKK